jgi:alpha-galactosidase
MTVRSLLASAALAGLLALSMPAVVQADPVADPLAAKGKWSIPERTQARTPPMGWNSWNAFRTEVDEAKVMGAAKVMVDSGLSKLGYTYVNIDDGWWLKRRQTDGRLEVRTAIFPSAKIKGEDTSFRPYTDTLHKMGLKAGIYTDIGRNACSQAYDLHSPNLPEGTTAEREVGLQGHVDQDIGLYFKDWGFDYIKVDACGINVYGPGTEIVREHAYTAVPPLIDQVSINRTDVPAVRARYAEVAQALKTHNPDGDYILAICNWGSADVRSWGKDVGHMWRTSGDITPTWTRMLHNFDSASTRALYAKPGAWNDPDILFIGHGEFDQNHLAEARSHFALWAMINAPLLISYDLRQAPQSLMDIWGNADIVRLNQDSGGHQGVIAYASDDVQIIVKTLSNGKKAVALFNRGLGKTDVTLTAAQLKFADDAPVQLKNLWGQDRAGAVHRRDHLHAGSASDPGLRGLGQAAAGRRCLSVGNPRRRERGGRRRDRARARSGRSPHAQRLGRNARLGRAPNLCRLGRRSGRRDALRPGAAHRRPGLRHRHRGADQLPP